MDKIVKVICLVAVVCSFLITGCTHTNLSAYKPKGKICPAPIIEKLIILEPTDARPLKTKSVIWPMALIFIPLWPYGHQQVSPESFYFYKSRYRNEKSSLFLIEVGKTIRKDLCEAGIAKNTEFVTDKKNIQNDRDALYLHLTVKEAIWHRYLTAYGLSFPGGIFHLLGAPKSYGSVNLQIEAELKDVDHNTIAKKIFTSRASLINFLYYRRFHIKMMRCYGNISEELRSFVKENCVKFANKKK